MPAGAARAWSCTPSSSSRWACTPPRTAPASSAPCTRWSSTPAKGSWRGSWTSRPEASWSAVTASCTCSTCVPMRIERAELHELVLPLLEPFIISGGGINERRSLVVVLHDDAGHMGYGESPPFELPFYSEETLAGARDLLERVLLPRLVGGEFESPEAVDAALRENVRGNYFARAGTETAAWDLEAHRRGTRLGALPRERLGTVPRAGIDCGVALGIPADRRLATLTQNVARALESGYRRVKIKVAPGWCRE